MNIDVCKFNFITYLSEKGEGYLFEMSFNILTRREQEGSNLFIGK